MRFLKALRRCRDDGDHEALMRRMPDLYAAHALYTDAMTQRRLALEAYLLSRESFGKLADRYGLEERSIAVYEALFFDVVEHLDTDYIPVIVIALQSGHSPPGLDTIWRWFGFHGGPLVLDFLLGTNTGFIKPESQEEFGELATSQVRDELLRKVAVGVLTLTVDGRSAAKVLDIYLRNLKDQQRILRRSPSVAFRPNVMAMWDGLPSFLKTESESPKAKLLTSGLSLGSNGARPSGRGDPSCLRRPSRYWSPRSSGLGTNLSAVDLGK